MILPQQRVCIRVQPSVECFEQLNIVMQIEIIREEGRVFSCLYIKTGALCRGAPVIIYGVLFLVVAIEFSYGNDTIFEYFEVEVFVRRVDSIAFETEAHKDSFHAEHLFESRDDWN